MKMQCLQNSTLKDFHDKSTSLLLELVNIPSISGSVREDEPVEFLYSRFSNLQYFQSNPDHLCLIPGKGGKKSLFSLVKAKKHTKKTVLFIGHIDVVDIDVYGKLRNYAFNPEMLAQTMKNAEISEAARTDLESGKYLFGRGIMDMKCGVAIEATLFELFAENTELFDLNVGFITVWDEENNAEGMLSVVPHLPNYHKDFDLEFIAVINMEPSDASIPSTMNNHVFLGSIGKALGFYYSVGKETHVGNYFSGISAGLLDASINMEFEANTKYGDKLYGESVIPPAVLAQKCIVPHYSVTLPKQAVSYYNIFTVGKSPSEILVEMKNVALVASQNVRMKLKNAAKNWGSSFLQSMEENWDVDILTFEELNRIVELQNPSEMSNLKSYRQADFSKEATLDVREKCIQYIQQLISLYEPRKATIIIGFLPPFIPFHSCFGSTEKAKNLRNALSQMIDYARSDFGEEIQQNPFYSGISDLSYFGSCLSEDSIRDLSNNLALWGENYSLPLKEMQTLNIPVVNIGPCGRDAHKFTERLETDYPFEVLPMLLQYLLKCLA